MAVRRRRSNGGQPGSLLVFGCNLALTAVVVTRLVLPGQKSAPGVRVHAEPVLDEAAQFRNDEVAGYAWASDGGCTQVADCIRGNPAFREGCPKFARAHGETAAAGGETPAMPRIQP